MGIFMIKTEEISVVISGPVYGSVNDTEDKRWTFLACKSVRKMLPKAELILSTWEGTNCENIDYDQLVLSKDPGPNIDNVNRQILSRREGIKRAARKYVLAFRSESYIANTNFLNYFGKYSLHGGQCRFLKERVVIPAATPFRSGELFHMGDWYYFGLKEDLYELWDLPLCKLSAANKEKGKIFYNAHRYLITSFIRKHMPLKFDVARDINCRNRELYGRIMAENFVIVELKEFGLVSYKYPKSFHKCLSNQLWHYWASFTFNDWKKLYNKYCNGNEKIKRGILEFMGVYFYAPLYTEIGRAHV